jgi:RNA polymerase sigma factor (TIGR02999 family)
MSLKKFLWGMDLIPRTSDITSLLRAWGNGDQAALARLTAVLHQDLRRMARRYVRHERGGEGLQTTELLNEAYLRLVDTQDTNWQDRNHFFAVSAQIMRRILVDAARTRTSQKRGGGAKHIGYSTAAAIGALAKGGSDVSSEFVALDDALNRLEQMDRRKAKIIELRFFGGLSVEETADVLKVSPQTVMRDWRLARAWLARELRQ